MSRIFVPKGPIDKVPALVQIMAWRRLGYTPLSEPMLVNLLTHIYASLGLNELNVYADDVMIYTSAATNDELQMKLQRCVDNISVVFRE